MIDKDPLRQLEDAIKEIHDISGQYTRPILNKYPLLFGLDRKSVV